MKNCTAVLAVCMLLSTVSCATQDEKDAGCVFEIDAAQSRSLDFALFVHNYPDAYVQLSIEIDSLGKIARILDEFDGGQPSALNRLRESVSTWTYSGGCLKGTLCVAIDASDARVYIDDSRLEVVSGSEDQVIRRGRLHRIQSGNTSVLSFKKSICD